MRADEPIERGLETHHQPCLFLELWGIVMENTSIGKVPSADRGWPTPSYMQEDQGRGKKGRRIRVTRKI